MEFIFTGFFAHWYIGRYFRLWERMYFQYYVIWVLGLSLLVLTSGWLWDFASRYYRKKQNI